MKSILSRLCLRKGSNKLSGYIPGSANIKIDDVIETYFKKREWYYQKDVREDVIAYSLLFDGDNSHLVVRVYVHHDIAIYRIVCQLGVKLLEDVAEKGMIEINRYNQSSRVVCGCISPQGYIAFWLGRNIDGNTFSEHAFEADLAMCMTAADDTTAEIYQKSHEVDNKDLML